jgi:hypothetical protein
VAEKARAPFERRLAALRQARTPYENDWRLISDYVQPRKSRFLGGTPGHERDIKILNGSPKYALRTLGSGMHAGLSSPARPWFRLTTDDPGMMEWGPVRDHLNDIAQVLMAILAQGNLYRCLHGLYRTEGQFGTAAMLIEGDFDSVMRGHLFPMGEYYLAADADGVVRTLYRETSVTVGQWVGIVGLENVSNTVRRLWDRSDTEASVQVCHAIEPNDDRIAGRADWKGKAWRSVWWEKDSDADKLARVEGYEECPIIAPRWDVPDLGAWGEGPGHDVLNDCISLQRMEIEKQRLIAKISDPPTAMPAAARLYANTPASAGQQFFFDGPPEAGRALYQVPHDITPLAMEIGRTERRIDTGLYRDMFMIIAQSAEGPEKTARQILEMKEEKMLMLGPTVERQHAECLGPLIDRAAALAQRAGLFPPAPPELNGRNISVDYLSPLAQAQKMVDATSIERMITFVGALSGLNPNARHKLDHDQAIDEFARIYGVNSRIVVPDDKVAKIRAAEAQAQQQAQQVQMATTAIEGARAMSETSVESGTLLGRLAGMQ